MANSYMFICRNSTKRGGESDSVVLSLPKQRRAKSFWIKTQNEKKLPGEGFEPLIFLCPNYWLPSVPNAPQRLCYHYTTQALVVFVVQEVHIKRYSVRPYFSPFSVLRRTRRDFAWGEEARNEARYTMFSFRRASHSKLQNELQLVRGFSSTR